MRKRDKTCAKATPEEPKREQRIVCLMSEEELRIVDRYLAVSYTHLTLPTKA